MTATITAPPAPAPVSVRLGVPCPTCGDGLPGLLALCLRPACLTAFLDDDLRFTRWEDQ